MTYKLNPEISKIKSPVILRIEDGEASAEKIYADGAELANAVFEKDYVAVSVAVRNHSILLVVRENRDVNNMNWIGSETAESGFF